MVRVATCNPVIWEAEMMQEGEIQCQINVDYMNIYGVATSWQRRSKESATSTYRWHVSSQIK